MLWTLGGFDDNAKMRAVIAEDYISRDDIGGEMSRDRTKADN